MEPVCDSCPHFLPAPNTIITTIILTVASQAGGAGGGTDMLNATAWRL